MSASPETGFTELVDEDWEIVCDYASQSNPAFCDGNRAEWVMRAKCPECKFRGQRLLCTPCKNLVMSTPHAAGCLNCEATIVPFRRAFIGVEPLR